MLIIVETDGRNQEVPLFCWKKCLEDALGLLWTRIYGELTGMLTNAGATYMQGRVHVQALRHRLVHNWFEGRLMLATIVVFMLLYMVVAFMLVNNGMLFVHRLPLIGPVLTERILFLLFFFFFVMLVLSNAAITGIGLFRRQETGWMLSLPIPHSSVVMWKTVEGMLLSSWGLLLLSAPILAGFGQAFDAGVAFYVVSVPAILCLIAVASNVSTWLLLLVIRFYRPWWLRVAVVVLVVLVGMIIFQMRDARSVRLVSGDVAANANQILRHTQICAHPLLPSSWVAETVIAAGKSLTGRVWFYNLILLSYALAAWVVTSWLAGRLFYPTWNRSLRRAEQKRNRPDDQAGSRAPGWLEKVGSRLGWDRATRALLAKDGYTFIREPMQWGQCALIFGLLLLYTSNLRNLGYNYRDSLWSAVISYLNLTVCCLAMSTLTTRFVFPQFSMEGQRLWILGLAPFPLRKVLKQKLIMNLVASTPLTVLLVAVSSYSLDLPLHRALFFVSMMVLLTFGLNALSLSLGVLLPNFKETNSAKIVSGFGGTLCLVLSFFYIVVGVTLAIYPTYQERKTGPRSTPSLEQLYQWEFTAVALVAALTLVVAGVPYFFALQRTKRLAKLGNL
jgi:ABC-2 type transport system permease protein